MLPGHITIALSFEKKKTYICKQIEANSGRSLHSVVKKLTDKTKETVLPNAKSDKILADDFLIYFKEKIEKIRKKFIPTQPRPPSSSNPDLIQMSKLEPATLEEIIEIARSYTIKCSPDDPVPASILKSCVDTFAPYWLEIVNLSLEIGDMEGLKSAVLIPLIKELSSAVDTDNFKNYRPVSNLLFVSKLIERVVQVRLQDHMARNGLTSDKNYAYMKNHCTEHLLLKVVNDLYLAL